MRRLFDSIRFYTKLAIATLFYNSRQYTSLFLVCVVGISIMFLTNFATDGMLTTIHNKSRIYYGGDITFRGGHYLESIPDVEGKTALLKELLPEGTKVYRRIDRDARESTIFFEGAEARLWQFRGVNFDEEGKFLSGLGFVSGGPEVLPERNGILISKFIADKLNAKVGDAVTLQLNFDDSDYINTCTAIVSGIFTDSSIFGLYTAYMDIRLLARLMAKEDGYVDRLCISMPGGKLTQRTVEQLQAKLEQRLNMFPLNSSISDFRRAIYDVDSPEKEDLFFIIPLKSNVKDFQMIMNALSGVVAVIVAVLMLIICIGVGSTYRIIVMKRTTEIGTYRSLGMTHTGVRLVFITESFYLLVVGFLLALAVSLAGAWVLSLFNMSFVSAFDLFLVNGHLLPSINLLKSLLLFLVVIVTTILAMLFTIRNVVHISPVGALAATT